MRSVARRLCPQPPVTKPSSASSNRWSLMQNSFSRRTLLRGLGAAISLPVLDAMADSMTSTAAPLRLAYIYVPNGVHMPLWTPASDGAGFELPRILAPLAPHRDNVLVLSGLTQNTGRALGDAEGDHA